MTITSGSWPDGLPEMRSEADVRAIRGRRELLEVSMRAEGTPEPVIERLATDDTAGKMLAYESSISSMIVNLFGGIR